LIHPDIIEVRTSDMRWQRHMYTDDTGEFPSSLNKWEKRVIEEALADTTMEGWLRNPDRKPWSLAIPYEFLGETRPLYPDFLIFRREGATLKVDLLDPHLVSLEDAPAKAAGLARYAAKHGAAFGRIELIIVENERIQRLNLKNEEIRDRVKAVTSSQHLRDLFSLA
jgi:type III restriction enzyme